MVNASQPVRAIQPTIGMMKMSPWTTILLNQAESWNGQEKLSPTLVTGEECNASRTVRKNRLSTEVSVRALTAAQPIVGAVQLQTASSLPVGDRSTMRADFPSSASSVVYVVPSGSASTEIGW